jgi:hypothetical protein
LESDTNCPQCSRLFASSAVGLPLMGSATATGHGTEACECGHSPHRQRAQLE